MTVLLIGAGYFPWLTSGEKNFFFRLLPLLRQQINVSVFSLNDYHQPELVQETEAGNIPVFCAKRPFHRDCERFFFQGNGYTSYHHRHKPPQEIMEKFVSMLAHLPRLRHIIQERQIQVIHFMDNFGLAMPFLARAFPKVKVTFSAANYDPRGRKSLYNNYLKYSIGYIDGAGVYTQAYTNILRQLGIKIPLARTSWGVPTDGLPLTHPQKQAIRQHLNIADDQILLLWSGYLQQIQEADYYKTTAVARNVLQKRPDITFLFAFKPETYQTKYATEASERLKVMSGLKNFVQVLETADLFCSPISNMNSTVSPPLTWLEAMSKGTPVITTAVGGVDEIIAHQQNGYISPSYNELADMIVQQVQKETLTAVSQAAQQTIYNHYSLKHAANSYLQFWQTIIATPKKPKDPKNE